MTLVVLRIRSSLRQDFEAELCAHLLSALIYQSKNGQSNPDSRNTGSIRGPQIQARKIEKIRYHKSRAKQYFIDMLKASIYNLNVFLHVRSKIKQGRFFQVLSIPLLISFLFSPRIIFSTSQSNQTEQNVITIPLIDLAAQKDRQVIVDKEPGQYLGHPTTVLLEDQKTILCVYPKGHGKGAICLKKSTDGGLSWSDRLPVPENWATSLETPTIYRVIDRAGRKRLILFSGLYPCRMSVSENDGESWTPLAEVGDWGGIVTMSSLVRLKNGDDMALFHDDGRFFKKNGSAAKTMTLYKTFSRDGGLTWSSPEEIFKSDKIHLCEPGAVRSPDGKQIAALLRENTRTRHSFVIFSDDEGQHWTTPRELPASLTGDRHTAKYAPDGRLFISFRDMAADSPWRGDWVAWVGTYDDIAQGRLGQYRIRLMDNHKDGDCAYPGVEVLPDGTCVATTYGHWIEGESPFIVSVRLKLSDIDTLADRLQRLP
jgi:hypothetical protein